MQNLNERKINFIREQDGDVEREFKNKIRLALLNFSQPYRAYLVIVSYENKNELHVAICFKMKVENKEHLLDHTVRIFKDMFGTTENLDIIFLNNKEELEVRKVCCPFITTPLFQITTPDFYLVSSEGYNLQQPVACVKRKKLYGKHPDGYLLCDINPPLVGQNYGMGDTEIRQIVLTSRHQNYSIFLIEQWPSYVNVAIPAAHILEDGYIGESDLTLIAWGELYKNLEDIR